MPLQNARSQHPPATLEQAHHRIGKFREHYNTRRPHQALGQSTPHAAWQVLEHTPAGEPLELSVLEAKAAEYRGKRRLGQQGMHVWDLTVTKDGQVLSDDLAVDQQERPGNELLVRVTKDNHQVYYQGLQVKLPSSYGGQEFYQVVTEKEFLLVDPRFGRSLYRFPYRWSPCGSGDVSLPRMRFVGCICLTRRGTGAASMKSINRSLHVAERKHRRHSPADDMGVPARG